MTVDAGIVLLRMARVKENGPPSARTSRMCFGGKRRFFCFFDKKFNISCECLEIVL